MYVYTYGIPKVGSHVSVQWCVMLLSYRILKIMIKDTIKIE